MKNTIKLILAFIGLSIVSCTDEIETIDAVTPSTGIQLLNPASTFNMVLDGTKLNNKATTIVWKDSNNQFGSTTTTYTIEAAKGGTNFAAPIVMGTTTSLFMDVTVGQLDTTAKNLGIQPRTEGVIDIRVKSAAFTSNVNSIKVTPYQPNWGIIGSATPLGWNNSTDMTYNPQTGKYTLSLALTAGEFKFRLDNSWTTNYGDNGNNLSLEANGANIPVNAGRYTIVLDIANLSYTITPIVNGWGIIGSATPTGWDSDTLLDFNATTNTYTRIINLVPGEFKFRLNADWGTNYGDNGNNLTLEAGGSNIPVAASGTYYLTVNFNTLVYTITKL
jgi:hypothetical protein